MRAGIEPYTTDLVSVDVCERYWLTCQRVLRHENTDLFKHESGSGLLSNEGSY